MKLGCWLLFLSAPTFLLMMAWHDRKPNADDQSGWFPYLRTFASARRNMAEELIGSETARLP